MAFIEFSRTAAAAAGFTIGTLPDGWRVLRYPIVGGTSYVPLFDQRAAHDPLVQINADHCQAESITDRLDAAGQDYAIDGHWWNTVAERGKAERYLASLPPLSHRRLIHPHPAPRAGIPQGLRCGPWGMRRASPWRLGPRRTTWSITWLPAPSP